MTLTANRESTNVIASPMKFNPDISPKDFTRKQTQTIIPNTTEINLNDKS